MIKPKDFPLIDIFPYKIKDREAFYDRNHPENIPQTSSVWKHHWRKHVRRSVEGHWVNDKGTWVFMYPKLYWHINIVKISDKSSKDGKSIISPRLRDNEWILFTYDMVTDGFSGFLGDEEYTCHRTVGKIQEGEQVDEIEMEKLPDNVYKKDGTLKKYVEAWYYLTRHYLIDNPAKKPLGIPLYDNEIKNGLVVTTRGFAKSIGTFVGMQFHDFTFNGIKYFKDYKHIEDRQFNFFLGSPDDNKIKKSLEMIKLARRRLPGGYVNYIDIGGKSVKVEFPSPFYVSTKGSWEIGEEVTRTYKVKGGNAAEDKGSGSLMEMRAMAKHTAATGDRYLRVDVEEVGLLKFGVKFYGSVYNSMIANGRKVGKLWMIGTGGDIEAIQDTKTMFLNVDDFDIYGIPNYWNKGSKTKIGLFVPLHYEKEDYKDPQGNTRLELVHKAMLKLEEKMRGGDNDNYKLFLMNNPFIPDHIFYSSNHSILPSEAAMERLIYLENSGAWKRKAKIGWLFDSPKAKNGVKFVEDPINYKPINNYLNVDPYSMDDKAARGAVIIYEHPKYPIEKDLYKIVIDTVMQEGEGSSFNSVIVYKSIDGKGGMQDTIVAEWLGRLKKGSIHETFEHFLRIIKYFGYAKTFPEINLDEFITWIIRTKKLGRILQEEAYLVEKDIFKNYSRSRRGVGYKMRGKYDKLAMKCDRWQRDWLLEERRAADPENEIPLIRGIDTIYSLRYLNEVAYFTPDSGNYDHISSMRGLQLWLRQEMYKAGADKETIETKIEKKKTEFRFEEKKPGIFN